MQERYRSVLLLQQSQRVETSHECSVAPAAAVAGNVARALCGSRSSSCNFQERCWGDLCQKQQVQRPGALQERQVLHERLQSQVKQQQKQSQQQWQGNDFLFRDQRNRDPNIIIYYAF